MVPPPGEDTATGDPSSGRHPVIKQGEFPFPVLAGGRESRQMLWVRNHANYMARRGLLDYVRAISVMIRGAIVNIMIGLPFLILVALAVAALSVYGWGFRAAAGLLVFALAWVILSPISERLWAVVRIRNTIALGTNSSVAVRDRFERAFGAVVVLIVVAAVFESLSFFLDDFHFWTREQPRDGRAVASLATFSLGLLSTASRIIPRLEGKTLKAAVVVVGLIGAVSPLLVVMFFADFLVYTGPTKEAAIGVAIAGLVLAVIVVIGILVGVAAGALSRRSGGIALAVAVVLTIVLVDPAAGVVDAVDTRRNTLDDRLAELDLSVDSVPELRTYEVDANGDLVRDERGRALPVYDEEEFRQRARDFRKLVEDVANRPPTVVNDLVEFLDRGVEQVSSIVPTVEFVVSQRVAGDPQQPLFDDATSLGKAATRLPGVYCLVQAVAISAGEYGPLLDQPLITPAPADPCCPFSDFECFREADGELEPDVYGDVYDDLFELDDRMFQLVDILDVDTGDPADLIREVLVDLNEPIIEGTLGGDLATDLPALAAEFPGTFAIAQDELTEIGRLLREVRIEANRVAIFSSQYPSLRAAERDLRTDQLWGSAVFALMLAGLLWAYVWIAVDPNRTSLHRLYRDRLAAAFLVGEDTGGDVDVEEDLDLGELSRHEAGSTAPYHLINAAVNLPRSKNINIHDRKSDFFIFSKRFIGSEHTGYCRSDSMERAFPDMSLSTAMAVSGAAASPAMGSMTQPALVALMTILNIRLGFWLPNPGKLEDAIGQDPKPPPPPKPPRSRPPGFTVGHVLRSEEYEVERRWKELEKTGRHRVRSDGTLGLACSGGGIRSATLNLGIAQALHQAGVFDHIDYLSTVSGGGFFGSGVSSAMRSRESTRSRTTGRISAIKTPDGLEVVIEPVGRRRGVRSDTERAVGPPDRYHFGFDATLCPEADPRYIDEVKAGTRLLDLGDPDVIVPPREEKVRARDWWSRDRDPSPFALQFRWRAKPTSLLREFAGNLDETKKWVNVSDGGHIENLGIFELLRRRVKFIIVGDGEFDPNHEFGSLTAAMRAARLMLNTRIVMDLESLRPYEAGRCTEHWTVGRIEYPDGELGYLLYMKSSITKVVDEDIIGYRVKNPAFPHQPTADQFFDEGQFEAYRRLGYAIARSALRRHEPFEEHLAEGRDEHPDIQFDEVEAWFTSLAPEPADIESDDGPDLMPSA